MIPIYYVDAFTDRLFTGNPAAVCILAEWLPDAVLQAIAAENNLSETAFVVPQEERWELRWFTPTTEVDLCGHATLATAHVLFHHYCCQGERLIFHTKSGDLTVLQAGDFLTLDFPALPPRPCSYPSLLVAALGEPPLEVLCSHDYLVVYDQEETIVNLRPDLALLPQLDLRGVIITARGKEVDFVSRFFAPKLGIPEDPVTGSAHCTLIPYWGGKLGKGRLKARQLSRRGGYLEGELQGERVLLAGQAVTYMQGTIDCPLSANLPPTP
ncbi:MAG: PhzF family phenazine biosynthesis protein [Pseudanabaenaceae cyanobacterium SKYGB_i_bin29]|nr:PhzF family phenazine biosynthesis protein [Pseudanabaenaceae cyanobacterium SKYG29]MDW8422304.1 PhzF family phenazine biosynthesis protein [Pseudanabaenaceae cyanobacterium SKYGB_i_bin29]